ncbi:hypothetical protein BKA62DRAFT_676249 [Auriculariales sp. MPI-PUGE-AT-0066]|nr:hypothetical protein BKA62DRAFT_676249 [Auriculariales sp. MPI-PUGE-AT-0066]
MSLLPVDEVSWDAVRKAQSISMDSPEELDSMALMLLRNLEEVDKDLGSAQQTLDDLVQRRITAEHCNDQLSSELSLWRAGGSGIVPHQLTTQSTQAFLPGLVKDCEQHVRRLREFKIVAESQQLRIRSDLDATKEQLRVQLTAHHQSKIFQLVKAAATCSIHGGIIDEPRVAMCGHAACANCFTRNLDQNGEPLPCPQCGDPMMPQDVTSLSLKYICNMSREPLLLVQYSKLVINTKPRTKDHAITHRLADAVDADDPRAFSQIAQGVWQLVRVGVSKNVSRKRLSRAMGTAIAVAATVGDAGGGESTRPGPSSRAAGRRKSDGKPV